MYEYGKSDTLTKIIRATKMLDTKSLARILMGFIDPERWEEFFQRIDLELLAEGVLMNEKYTMELQVDIKGSEADVNEKKALIRQFMRNGANLLFAQACMMASEERKPIIAVFSSDFFDGTDVIELNDEVVPEEVMKHE